MSDTIVKSTKTSSGKSSDKTNGETRSLEDMSKSELIEMLKQREVKIEELKTKRVLGGTVVSLGVDIEYPVDLTLQLSETSEVTEKRVSERIGRGLKIAQTVTVGLSKPGDPSGDRIKTNTTFRTKPVIVTNRSQAHKALDQTSKEILSRFDGWINRGSGWTLVQVLEHSVYLYTYEPMRREDGIVTGDEATYFIPKGIAGSSYLELPKVLRNSSKGLINMQNNDHKCFMWCHVRSLRPAKRNPNRVTKEDRRFAGILDYQDVRFPVTLDQIPRIEDQNDIKVNVFGYECGQFYPLHIGEPRDKVLDLLLISDSSGKGHYVLITKLNALLYGSSKHKGAKHFCRYCIQGFSSEEVLNQHMGECLTLNGAQATQLPDPGSTIKYTNYHKQLMAPFIIYADFESVLVPCGQADPVGDESFTIPYQNHECCGFGYKVVCSYDPRYTKESVIFRGKNAVVEFLNRMIKEEESCGKILDEEFNKKLTMTRKDNELYRTQKECHICGKKISKGKVRDHCHVTGKFRGAAHKACNVVYRLTKTVPVVFHNLRGYDAHFLVLGMGEFNRRIGIIPNNFERYMTVSWGKLRFIDSLQFMASSLDRLVANLPPESFTQTDGEFSTGKRALVKRKGVFPYEYFDGHARFSEGELPGKDKFYSRLACSGITDEDYNHAKNVWKTFKMKTLGDYHDLYLKTDVLLLADVFEEFRKVCLSNYGLDPAHYLSSPGLSWDAMLKFTEVELDLVSDADHYQMIEKGMRGGVSYISKRHSKANNEMVRGYNKAEDKKWLMYLDANNLYGWAMSKLLPTGGFRFLERHEIDNFNPTLDRVDKGYYLEVDLEIPSSVHDLMSDYPVAPEKPVVHDSMLSDYCRRIKEKLGCDSGKTEKLLTTLLPKSGYVLHHENLRLYLNLGAVLIRIHRAIEFDQRPFLKGYINLNTNKRSKAKNAFEKDFYKLMNNAVYGKTCENLRKRVSITLVNNERDMRRLVRKPTFVSAKVFTENLVAVHQVKKRLLLNKPSYVGCAVLELSKTLMYDFHYNWILKKFGFDNVKLLFTDTDSLTYEIRTKNVYQSMTEDRGEFDFSGYAEDNKYFTDENKKVIGKMKDECNGIAIAEFVGLRSKMYSYMLANDKGDKKAKGVKKGVVKKDITHEDYKSVITEEKLMRHNQQTIRSNKHQVGTYEVRKISLSCFDDKRFILEDGITSLPYGHYKTPRVPEEVAGAKPRSVPKAKGFSGVVYPVAIAKYAKAMSCYG